MSLEELNYHEQEDLKCCKNCVQVDIAHSIIGLEEYICTLFHDQVSATGWCDEGEV